jgi:electron transport complex protein RnfB
MDKTSEKRFQKLAEHLDRLPGGFGTSDSGADLRLLRRLFTLEEAELATHLTLNAEPVEVIGACTASDGRNRAAAQ